MEIRIVREPKGGPDIIFVGPPDTEKRLLLAGDYLSVRGLTARVVTLPAGVFELSSLSEEERSQALDGGAPCLCISEANALLYAEPATIASAALKELRE